MTQHIRLSQFVHTYGPGALLESADGPRLITMPDIGLFSGQGSLRPDSLELSHQRMSNALLGGARIFRLPSNAEIGVPERRGVYATRAFPEWSLCLNVVGHGRRCAVLYRASICPECQRAGQNRRHEAIRFVIACPEGHLDDVNWKYVVHRGSAVCQNRSGYLEWHGGGGSLAGVKIVCPDCSTEETLGRAYGHDWYCSGRTPEREPIGSPPARSQGCRARARIIQRQATNLRIPELRTLFTIPPIATTLHTLIQGNAVVGAVTGLQAGGSLDEASLSRTLQALVTQGRIGQEIMNSIMAHPWTEIDQAITDVLRPGPTDFEGLLREEFAALLTAASTGFPPVLGPPPQSRLLFDVDPSQTVYVTGPGGHDFRVTPIQRLQTVTVQVGFRREVSSAGGTGSFVDVSFRDALGERWYPGAEFLGEGLFVTLNDDGGFHYPLTGRSAETWALQREADFTDALFRLPNAPDEIHPVFIWWHTLAHLLIRALAVDAGYSASAIRERIYLELDAAGRARGGLVLYATQPGSEGSLGGLLALAPHFGTIFSRAVELARHCSNDPLCEEQRVTVGAVNGPACYGCVLASETSCEHRNLWLDRTVFLDNLP